MTTSDDCNDYDEGHAQGWREGEQHAACRAEAKLAFAKDSIEALQRRVAELEVMLQRICAQPIYAGWPMAKIINEARALLKAGAK